ncbi:MAG: hypothetical protein IT445_12865 [Phycisphaeraceae bacterium]|nr:hypothetical protein [Phycisphaeraceae bacterium]
MMCGLLLKTWRETRWLTVICCAAILVVEVVLTCIVPRLQQNLPTMLNSFPFMRDMISGLLGIKVRNTISPAVFSAILWIHPVVFVILWAHQVIFHTRYPAAEIDRGTVDLLLGLPVSRGWVYLSEALAATMSVILVIGFALLGHVIGRSLARSGFYPPVGQILIILLNLLLLLLAIGGITSLFSAMSNRRGYAIGWAVAVVAASSLVSFAAQWWPILETPATVSVMEYYYPAGVLMGGGWPVRNMIVLAAVAMVTWSLGASITTRRSICTV